MVVHPIIRLRAVLPEGDIDSADLSLNHIRNRNTLRSFVINEFLKEQPGTGNKELTSVCRYDAEELSDGRKVYLTRPAYLNKGFDFVVNVEGMIFPNGKTNPRHEDIFSDINLKIAAVPQEMVPVFKQQMLEMIEKI